MADDHQVSERKHAELLSKLRDGMETPANLSAMLMWYSVNRPEMLELYQTFIKDATKGNKSASTVVIMLMMAFAAGRAYQEAKPDASKDWEGYGY